MERRQFLQTAVAGAMGTAVSSTAVATPGTKYYQKGLSPWPIVLNASTIRPTPLIDKINAAHKAGYDGIELWIDELTKYETDGGNLVDLGKKIQDMGMYVNNIIGLWGCMPAGEEAFQASLEGSRNRMRIASAVGAQCIAAIPSPDREDFEPKWGVRCYKELLKIGREDYNIRVAFEFVGFLKGIHNFGEAAGIAIDTNDPDACLIMDTFHMFRGGSFFNGVRHINGDFIADFHWNDVPDTKPREEMGDADRIYPGDGILPLKSVLLQLLEIGYKGPLSLELFMRSEWEKDPNEVAKLGMDKMQACISSALG